MTKFEKRILAGALSAVMCVSALWTPAVPVRAEDAGVEAETTVEGADAAKENFETPKGSLAVEAESAAVNVEEESAADAVEPQETEEKTEPQEIVVETEAKDAAAGRKAASIVEGMHETTITEAGQEVEYLFVPKKTGVYYIWVEGSADGSMPGYSMYSTNERGGRHSSAGVEEYVDLVEGEECRITISYHEDFTPSTGTIAWGIRAAEEVGLGEYETVIAKAGEKGGYRFVPKKTGFYQVWVEESTNGSRPGYSIKGHGSRYSEYGVHEYLNLTAGEEYNIAISYEKGDSSTGTIVWGMRAVTDIGLGEHETVITEAGQKAEYCFVAEKAGVYSISVEDTADGSNPGRVEISLEEEFLAAGEERFFTVCYAEDSEPATGTIFWNLKEVEVPVRDTETIYSETGETENLFYRFVAPDSGKYQALDSGFWSVNFSFYDENGEYVRSYDELERGKVYFIEIFGYDENNSFQWSVSKIENVNAEAGQTYQKEKGKSAEYLFTPKESGRYQIQYKMDIENETGSYATFEGDNGKWSTEVEETKAFNLEKGKTYRLICNLWEKATVCFQPVKLSELELGKEYTLTSEAEAYRFIPDQTNTYVIQGGDVKIWDENWKEVEQFYTGDSVYEENKIDGNNRVVLEAGKIYYFEFYETEGKRKVEADKLSGDYSYLINEDGTAQILGYLGKDSIVTVPDTIDGKNVGSIGYSAFSRTDVTEVVIPDSVTEVKSMSFASCNSLQNVTLGTGVTRIEYSAFSACYSLKDLEFPDSLEHIGRLALAYTEWEYNQPDGVVYANKVLYGYKGNNMPENTEITVKEGTLSITQSAFSWEKDLKAVELPDSLLEIGSEAFHDCALSEITIPRKVKTIGEKAFGYVDNNGKETKIEGFVIYGVPRSAAERYAQENGFEFVPTVSYIKGDVTEDGEIDIRDLRIVLRSVCKKTELTEQQSLAADVTEDSVVDIRDLRKVLRYVCHKITEL